MLKSYLAFDVETTGLSPESDEIIEIGALKVQDGKVCDRFITFVKPSEPVSERITEITGITNEMLQDAAPKEKVIPAFLDFCGDEVLIGHNLPFDYGFVRNQAKLFGLSFEKQGIDKNAVSLVTKNASIYIPLSDLIDPEKEIERLKKEEKRLEGELKRSRSMLSNEKFTSKAPKEKVEEEQNKLLMYEEMMKKVVEQLKELES